MHYSQIASLLILPWIIGPVYNVIYKVLTAKINARHQCTVLSEFSSPSSEMWAGILYLLLEFILPLFLLVYLYGRILRVLLHYSLNEELMSIAPGSGEF